MTQTHLAYTLDFFNEDGCDAALPFLSAGASQRQNRDRSLLPQHAENLRKAASDASDAQTRLTLITIADDYAAERMVEGKPTG